MMTTFLKTTTALAVIALLIAAPATAAAVVEEEKVVERAAVGEDGIQRVTIVAKRGGYFFSPNHIILKKGVKTELTFVQKGWAFRHHIVMDSPEASMKFRKFMTQTPRPVVFTPTEVGTYPIWCDAKIFWLFGPHRERGMEAVIEVVE